MLLIKYISFGTSYVFLTPYVAVVGYIVYHYDEK